MSSKIRNIKPAGLMKGPPPPAPPEKTKEVIKVYVAIPR